MGRLLVVPATFVVLLAVQLSGTRDPFIIFAALGTAIVLSLWAVLSHRQQRARPEAYIGKFRREDGAIIHVARMPSGRLWAASNTQPPQGIGYVDGREVMRWEKLGTEPDA